jgi:hypothetical protein
MRFSLSLRGIFINSEILQEMYFLSIIIFDYSSIIFDDSLII